MTSRSCLLTVTPRLHYYMSPKGYLYFYIPVAWWSLMSRNDVEFADRLSRNRALGTTLAVLAFLGVQLVARPVFRNDGYAATGPRSYMWALNAGVLLLFLLPAGGVMWGNRIRALVNDEVSRAHAHTGIVAGFWTAMVLAFAIYLIPAAQHFTAREATYVIVTPTVAVSLLTFAWLEARAYRDG